MHVYLFAYVLGLLVPSGHPHAICRNVTLPGSNEWIESSLSFPSSSDTYTLPNVATLLFSQPAGFNFSVTHIVLKARALNVRWEHLPVSELQSSCVSGTLCTAYEGPLPFLVISNATAELTVCVIWESGGDEVRAFFSLKAQSFLHSEVDHSVDQRPYLVGSYARLPPLVVEQRIEELPVSLRSSTLVVRSRGCSRAISAVGLLETGGILNNLTVWLDEECWGGTDNTDEGVFSVEVGGSPVFYFGHQVVLQPESVSVSIVNDSLVDMSGRQLQFEYGGFQALVSWGTAEPFFGGSHLRVFLLGAGGFRHSFCTVFPDFESQKHSYSCVNMESSRPHNGSGVFKLAVMYLNYESDFVVLAESSAFNATWASAVFAVTDHYQIGSGDVLKASWTMDGERPAATAMIEIKHPEYHREFIANVTYEDGYYVFEDSAIAAIEQYIERYNLHSKEDFAVLVVSISSSGWRFGKSAVEIWKQSSFLGRYGWYIAVAGAVLLIIVIFTIFKCRKAGGERLLQYGSA